MKPILTIVFSALALGASCYDGFGSQRPISPHPQFNFSVSAFRAKCSPHKVNCSFNFRVAVDGASDTITCSVDLPSAAKMLPPVLWTYCSDGETFWGFTPVEPPGGNASHFALILADANLGQVGTKLWGAEDFPVIEGKTAMYQQYSGPTGFEV